MNDRRRSTYLIQDPYDDDAQRFIRDAFTYFGLRPVCFYTDRKARFYGEQQYPELCSGRVEASYDVDLGDLETFARQVTRDYRVTAIIPYREDTVEVAAELCQWLDLEWNPPEVLARFRNKHAMKSWLREHSDVVVPATRFVATAAELFEGAQPARFVLKPNDGMGNKSVGYFTPDDRDAIERHLAQPVPNGWVMEEFVDGPEYHVDGQVRTDGTITVLAVSQYQRVDINDYRGVYSGEWVLTSGQPEFAPLVEYATRLIAATGLRRCPFHMEVILGADGPRMIDLGARLPSDGGGNQLSRLHPQRPDAYAVALHDYLGPNRFALDPIDWSVYDANVEMWAYGISTDYGLLASLSGVDELEADPDFITWSVPPVVGAELSPTTELRGAPYICALRYSGDPDEARRRIDDVHELVSWTVEQSTWQPTVLLRNAQRVRSRGRWELHRLRERL